MQFLLKNKEYKHTKRVNIESTYTTYSTRASQWGLVLQQPIFVHKIIHILISIRVALTLLYKTTVITCHSGPTKIQIDHNEMGMILQSSWSRHIWLTYTREILYIMFTDHKELPRNRQADLQPEVGWGVHKRRKGNWYNRSIYEILKNTHRRRRNLTHCWNCPKTVPRHSTACVILSKHWCMH